MNMLSNGNIMNSLSYASFFVPQTIGSSAEMARLISGHDEIRKSMAHNGLCIIIQEGEKLRYGGNCKTFDRRSRVPWKAVLDDGRIKSINL